MGDRAKQAAGEAAAQLVESGMRLGLGTGSTVAYFLDALAERDLDVVGIPTSEATAIRCRMLGLTVASPGDVDRLDLAVDGADELTDDLIVTKGGGGALLREKIVAAMSGQFVVIATPDKVVDRLADSFALPVEVVPFGREPVRRILTSMGFDAVVRTDSDGLAVRTDNGNELIDAHWRGGLVDPEETDRTLAAIPGVVATGLFVQMTDLALLGRDDGTIQRLER